MAKKKIELKPEHFYMEGPYMVFTEKYHLDKGYCCANKCRHCPYVKRAISDKKKDVKS